METRSEAASLRRSQELGARTQVFATAYQLSPREREVLDLVCQGHHPKEVGGMIGAGYASVRTHLRRIYKKVGCSGVRELVIRLYGEGTESR